MPDLADRWPIPALHDVRDELLAAWDRDGYHDLRHLTDTDCDAVALQLNTRPRKTLEWQTPGQALNERLVATAG